MTKAKSSIIQVPVPLQAAKIETNTRYAESDAEFWFELQ